MYCFHSFNGRRCSDTPRLIAPTTFIWLSLNPVLLSFPLLVSSFLWFLSFFLPFAFTSTSLHLFASSFPPSLDSLHLPPPPRPPESSLPSFAASLLYLFQSQSSHEPKVVPVRHIAGRPRALICEWCRRAAVLYDFQLNTATYKFLHLAHLHRIQRKCRLISLKHISSSRSSLCWAVLRSLLSDCGHSLCGVSPPLTPVCTCWRLFGWLIM